MPSKLGAMLASGRPVLAMVTPDSPVGRSLGQGGSITPPGDAIAAAQELRRLADEPLERERLGRAARAAALALAQDRILGAIEVRLQRLLKAGPPSEFDGARANHD